MKIAMMKRNCSVMRNPSIRAYFYIFSDICEYMCVCLSVLDFGIDILLCTNNMSFSNVFRTRCH